MPLPTVATNPMISDNPLIREDLLQFDRYANAIVNTISRSSTSDPYTIAIYGRWGSGKTTLMHMVEETLGSKSCLNIWFVPWLYQSEDQLIAPLLQTIYEAMCRKIKWRFTTSVERIAEVTARVSSSGILKAITLDNVSGEDIEKAVQTYNKKYGEGISALHQLRGHLQELVDDITNKGKDGRCFFFIDDLDRCTPAKIVSVFESIKLFLDLKHTVVFMAVDKDIVQRGIQAYYRDFGLEGSDIEALTADYLEKMVQLPVYLYPLGPEQVGDYVRKLLGESFTHLPEEQRELFTKGLLPNPRKIKRVLNMYHFTLEIVQGDPQLSRKISANILTKLILLQQQWQGLYNAALANPVLLPVLEGYWRGDKRLSHQMEWAAPDQVQKIRDAHPLENQPAQLLWVMTNGERFWPENQPIVDLKPYFYMLG
jgi:hypothetical protein